MLPEIDANDTKLIAVLGQQFEQHCNELASLKDATAYDRTIALGEFLMIKGYSLPKAQVIREIIGGAGSFSSITQARNAFQNRLAEQLAAFSRGVPEVVSSAMLSIWAAAETVASHRAEENNRKLNQELIDENFRLGNELAEQSDQLEFLSARAKAQSEEIGKRAGEIEALKIALQESSAEKEQLKARELELQQAVIEAQKKAQEAIEQAQRETSKAMDRLEAVEARALVEIDNAKQAAANERDRMNASFNAERAERAIEIKRIENQLKERTDELNSLREENKTLLSESHDLKLTVAQFEHQIKELNRKLADDVEATVALCKSQAEKQSSDTFKVAVLIAAGLFYRSTGNSVVAAWLINEMGAGVYDCAGLTDFDKDNLRAIMELEASKLKGLTGLG